MEFILQRAQRQHWPLGPRKFGAMKKKDNTLSLYYLAELLIKYYYGGVGVFLLHQTHEVRMGGPFSLCLFCITHPFKSGQECKELTLLLMKPCAFHILRQQNPDY